MIWALGRRGAVIVTGGMGRSWLPQELVILRAFLRLLFDLSAEVQMSDVTLQTEAVALTNITDTVRAAADYISTVMVPAVQQQVSLSTLTEFSSEVT